MKESSKNVLSFKDSQNEKLFKSADFHYENEEFIEAVELFHKAAVNGDSGAMMNLASMYSAGEGVERNFDKAIEWELKAIEAGNETAMFNLGITYRMKGDITNSMKWFEEAYKLGDGYAALELAKLYSASPKETDTVKFYLQKALKSDDLFEDDIELAKNLLTKL